MKTYFDAQNRMKGNYKQFSLLPSLTICRDTQCKDMGFTSWELHFEWLWFLISFELENEVSNGK